MKNEFLTKDELVQVYMSCGMEDPDGMYADDVDLFEFTDALIKVLLPIISKAERNECIKFVRSLNSEVANALQENRGNL